MRRRAPRAGQPIEWRAVRERLHMLHSAAEAPELSREQAGALLDERARALSRPHADAPDGEAHLAVITFELGGERFAIETKYVRQIVRLEHLTAVPGVPDVVVGLTNYRGEILCVADLRRLVGAPASGLSDLSRLVILGLEAAEFAILADRVEGSPSLRAAEILPAPESTPPAARRLVTGVTRDALVLLNGGGLLDDPRLLVDRDGTGRN